MSGEKTEAFDEQGKISNFHSDHFTFSNSKAPLYVKKKNSSNYRVHGTKSNEFGLTPSSI